MRVGLIVVLYLSALSTGAQAQGTGKRFYECSFRHHPCMTSVIVEGTTDTCIAVHSPDLKNMYVTGIMMGRTGFGVSSILQSSFYVGPLEGAVQAGKDKPFCLCRTYDGFHDEESCDAGSLKPGRYVVNINIDPLEDISGNRKFRSTIGVAEFRIDRAGKVTNLPAKR